MTTHEIDSNRVLEEVRAYRTRLRYPFGPGLSETDLLGATMERIDRMNGQVAGKDGTAMIRSVLAAIASDREADAARKYRAILLARARRQWQRLGLPASRLDYEDLVSSAWTQAIASQGSFRGRTEADYVAWLNQIFDRLAINEQWYQQAGKRSPRRESGNGNGDSSRLRVEQQHDSHQTTPSEPARNREFVQALCRVLATFEPREIQALTLYCQGASMAAIGEALGLGRGKASSLIGKLLRRLNTVRGAAEHIRPEKIDFDEIVMQALNLGEGRRDQPQPDE